MSQNYSVNVFEFLSFQKNAPATKKDETSLATVLGNHESETCQGISTL